MKPEERELIKKIVEISTVIQEKYPELLYELEEYNYYTGGEEDPQKLQENPQVNYRSLASYLDTLKELLNKYLMEKNKKDLYLINHI
ncbi:MAG: hypothetical protein H0V01_00325 [Bacteroidetes bacterium]|nr:hypothetical protein [Bacteroidota bacterium]HET6245679.1 hypothetical protein [Bacteroidia bacterium]